MRALSRLEAAEAQMARMTEIVAAVLWERRAAAAVAAAIREHLAANPPPAGTTHAGLYLSWARDLEAAAAGAAETVLPSV